MVALDAIMSDTAKFKKATYLKGECKLVLKATVEREIFSDLQFSHMIWNTV